MLARRPGPKYQALGVGREGERMQLGERVAAMRKARGWSQAELGRRTGVAQTTILRIERGQDRNVSQATIMGLALAFGCAPADLLGDTTAPAGPPLAQLRAAGFTERELAGLRARWPSLSLAEQGRYQRLADVVYTQQARLDAERAALQEDLAALKAEQERPPEHAPRRHTRPLST